MNALGKYVGILFLILVNLPAISQNYAITQRGDKGTINDHFIHCIYQDSDGFIWVGTGTSVERYDGVRSLVYRYEGGGELNIYAGSLVNAILENHRHEYWVGNIRGLWRLNHSKQLAERMFPEQINCPVQALEKDDRNNLYIGTTNGLYIYDGQQVRHFIIDVKSIYPDDNHVQGIAIVDNQNSWLLTNKGVALYESQSGNVKIYPNTLSNCGRLLCFRKVGDVLYIGTEKRGIVKFDLKTYRFAPYWEDIKVPVNQLSSENGLLGVATSGEGLYLIDLGQKQLVYSITYHTDKKKGLLSNKISSVLLSQGNIWCGTEYYLGMSFLRNVEVPFRLYEKKAFTTKDITVRSSLHTGDYTFVGTREGFYRISESDGHVRYFTSGKEIGNKLRSNLIFSFYPFDDHILVGTCMGGISAFDPQTGEFLDTPLTDRLTSNDIFMCLEDETGMLWIAASDGLYSYDRHLQQIKEYNAANSGMPGNIVYGIYIDSGDRFWIGTDKGLTLFDRHTGKCKQQNLPAPINTKQAFRYIHEGKDGTLFFFQLPNLVFAADKELKSARRLFRTIGAYSMTQDTGGFYWFGTDFGVARADDKLEKISLSSLNELVNREMGSSSGAVVQIDEQGEVWIPCSKGLVIADPRQAIHHSPIHITEVLVNGEHLANNYTINCDSVLAIKENGNNVTFRFASLGYENPELMRYEYMLVGRDSIWRQIVGKNEMSFYNLPRGSYTFLVRKLLNEATVDQLTFRIKKKRVWGWYVSGTLVFGVLLFFAIRRQKTVIPAPVVTLSQEENADLPPSDSYVKLSDDEAQRIIDTLRAYMEKDKPYLNVDLKQSEVATAIGCSSHLLSAIFSHYLKLGYYDFVNYYRVDEFKQAVKVKLHEKYTLVTLAEKCGFKSKSSFFRTFKKFTGVTPNEYIQQQEKH